MNLNNNYKLPKLTWKQKRLYRRMLKENRKKAKENIEKTNLFVVEEAIKKAYKKGILNKPIDDMVNAIDNFVNPKRKQQENQQFVDNVKTALKSKGIIGEKDNNG